MDGPPGLQPLAAAVTPRLRRGRVPRRRRRVGGGGIHHLRETKRGMDIYLSSRVGQSANKYRVTRFFREKWLNPYPNRGFLPSRA